MTTSTDEHKNVNPEERRNLSGTPRIATNPHVEKAARELIQRQGGPPLLIRGPPGTKKTITLIATAIRQGLKTLFVLPDLESSYEHATRTLELLGLKKQRILQLWGRSKHCLRLDRAPPTRALCRSCEYYQNPHATKHNLYEACAEKLSQDTDYSPERITEIALEYGICPYYLQFFLIPTCSLAFTTLHMFLQPECMLRDYAGHFDLKVVSEADLLPRLLYEIYCPRIEIKKAVENLEAYLSKTRQLAQLTQHAQHADAIKIVKAMRDALIEWSRQLADKESKKHSDEKAWKPTGQLEELEELEELGNLEVLQELEKLASMSEKDVEGSLSHLILATAELPETASLLETAKFFQVAIETGDVRRDYTEESLKYRHDPEAARALRAIPTADLQGHLKDTLNGKTILETATPKSLEAFLQLFHIDYAKADAGTRDLANLNGKVVPLRNFNKPFLISPSSAPKIVGAVAAMDRQLPRRLPRGKQRCIVLVFAYRDAAINFLRAMSRHPFFDKWSICSLKPIRDEKGQDLSSCARLEVLNTEQIRRRSRYKRILVVDWAGSDHSRSSNGLGFAAGAVFVGRQRSSPNAEKAFEAFVDKGLGLAGLPAPDSHWSASWFQQASFEAVIQHLFRFHRRDEKPTRFLLVGDAYLKAPPVVDYFSFSDVPAVLLPESYEQPSDWCVFKQDVLHTLEGLDGLAYVTQIAEHLVPAASPAIVSRALREMRDAGRLEDLWLEGKHFFFRPGKLSRREAFEIARRLCRVHDVYVELNRPKGELLEEITARAIHPLEHRGWTLEPRKRWPAPDFILKNRSRGTLLVIEAKNKLVDAWSIFEIHCCKFEPVLAARRVPTITVLVAAVATEGARLAARRLGIELVEAGYKPVPPRDYYEHFQAIRVLGKELERPLDATMFRFLVERIRLGLTRALAQPSTVGDT